MTHFDDISEQTTNPILKLDPFFAHYLPFPSFFETLSSIYVIIDLFFLLPAKESETKI